MIWSNAKQLDLCVKRDFVYIYRSSIIILHTLVAYLMYMTEATFPSLVFQLQLQNSEQFNRRLKLNTDQCRLHLNISAVVMGCVSKSKTLTLYSQAVWEKADIYQYCSHLPICISKALDQTAHEKL